MTAPTAPPNPHIRNLARVWADHVHHFDDANLAHEAERLEALPPSAMADFMRHAVDAELASRAGAR